MADLTPYPGMPRWVKVSGVVVGVLALLVIVLIHSGSGPRHNITSAGSLGGQTAPDGGQ